MEDTAVRDLKQKLEELRRELEDVRLRANNALARFPRNALSSVPEGHVHNTVGDPPVTPVAGGTLDQAYDFGGTGAGRTINTTDGAVLLQTTEADAAPNLDVRRAVGDITKAAIQVGVNSDANPYLEVEGDGTLQWGAGGASAVDVELARTSAQVLEMRTPGGAAVTLGVANIAEQITNGRVTMTDGITVNQVLGLTQAAATLTVGGQLTATAPWMVVTSNSGTSDDMDNLATTGIATADGDTYLISAASGHTITIRDNSVSGGNISTMSGSAITLDSVEKVAILLRDGTTYYAGIFFAAGGAGDVATDAIWDAAGDLAVGTGANTAARLAVGAANTVLQPSGGTVAWVTDPTFNGVTVSQAFNLTGETDVTWGTQQDDYTLGDVSHLMVTLTADVTLTGMTGGADGRIVTITNSSSPNILTIAHNVTSAIANRFLIGADLVLGPREGATFRYDSSGPRWYCVGRSTGDMAHDKIWDAAGDLAVGTGADTAARLAIGAANRLLKSNGTTASWAQADLTTDVTGDLPLTNFAQSSVASKLLGRGSAAGGGDYQEITLGTGLSMSATTLNTTFARVWGGELDDTAQGADKLIIPSFEFQDEATATFDKLVIVFQTASTVAHSFTFFKDGVAIGSGVTVAAAARRGEAIETNFTLTSSNIITVRHDTNAQDANESASHVNEGGKIWAFLIEAENTS